MTETEAQAEATAEARHRHSQRGFNVLLGTSGAVLLALVLFGIFVVPQILTTGDDTAEIRDGNHVAACRAEFNADVTAARTEVDVARSTLELLTSEGLSALLDDDDETLLRVSAEMPAARDVVRTATELLLKANETNRMAVTFSREDPAGFLDACNAR